MPVASVAAVMRSGFSPKNTCRKPAPSSPTSRSAGTSTSSKKSWNCFSGVVISTGMSDRSSPGASVSTTNSESVARPLVSSVPVRVTTSIKRASSTPEMYVFVPRSR